MQELSKRGGSSHHSVWHYHWCIQRTPEDASKSYSFTIRLFPIPITIQTYKNHHTTSVPRNHPYFKFYISKESSHHMCPLTCPSLLPQPLYLSYPHFIPTTYAPWVINWTLSAPEAAITDTAPHGRKPPYRLLNTCCLHWLASVSTFSFYTMHVEQHNSD